MQGAAAAAVEAVYAPENFGQGPHRIAAATDDVTVIAMCRAYKIGFIQRLEDGGACRLLPDVEMIMADKFLLPIEINDRLFEMANHQHSLENRETCLAIEGHARSPFDSYLPRTSTVTSA